MNKKSKKVQKYCGRAVTWRTVAGQMRYSAEERTALDGKVWWCIFDHKGCTYIAGYRYKMMAECEGAIGRAILSGELPTDKSDYYEDPHALKTGKHKFAVDVTFYKCHCVTVEAKNRKEAQQKIEEMIREGEITPYTKGFEYTDDFEAEVSGEEKVNGEIMYY